MKCVNILLKLNTINIGCNTHEAVGVILTLISHVHKNSHVHNTCVYILQHHIHTNQLLLVHLSFYTVSYKFKWSGGFDTRQPLVIVVPGFAITSDDWSGRTSAPKKFAVGAFVLSAFDYFYPFLYMFVPYMNVVQFLREQLHSVGIQGPILCRNCEE